MIKQVTHYPGTADSDSHGVTVDVEFLNGDHLGLEIDEDRRTAWIIYFESGGELGATLTPRGGTKVNL